ncbi:MAG: DNA gyrase subunit A [bacterium]
MEQQETSLLKPVNIEDEMQESYLSYSMSVIVGRALPDVRDGLKPVHRRILFGMYELGLFWNKAFKKSARVVGDVMGKDHPHGDSAIYDTIVRMVQDFSLRYPLIWGQGNFGSVDGDSAAAMRYTEVRMNKITDEMLRDLEKNTVDFVPNYDDTTREPSVMPSMFPNLLVNGSSGIAVGMATNIPPHNLTEVINGVIMLIDRPEVSVDELMEVVTGPDFPTGAYINGHRGIESAYRTGRGKVRMRAVMDVEEAEKGERERIVVTELPYQVNKARLIEHIAFLVKNKKIEGISDLRDESARQGMRIAIDLKRGENANVIINQLYKHTSLQSSFGIIMLALVDNQPKVLNLRQVLSYYLDHRQDVVRRRTAFELAKAQARVHLLEGLIIALDHLDEVIKLIRGAPNAEEARKGLIEKFELSEIQARAILEMRLQRLTGLERDKIRDEYQALLKDIKRYQEILSDPLLVKKIIKEELLVIREAFGDDRRTRILPEMEDLSYEDLIADEKMVVTITHNGNIKRTPLTQYRLQRRRGAGVRGVLTKNEDFVEHLFVSSTHDYLMFFSNRGRVYWRKVYEIPQTGRNARGNSINNFLNLQEEGEEISTTFSVRDFSADLSIIMATRRGIIKRSSLSDYGNPRAGGIKAINLDEGDELINVAITDGMDDVLMATREGRAIHFKSAQVRCIGRTCRGVIGIRMRGDDELIGMAVVNEDTNILTVTEKGYGKVSKINHYSIKNRGGYGVLNLRITNKNGRVCSIKPVKKEDSIMLITSKNNIIWISVSDISVIGRVTQGVRLQRLEKEERIMAVAKLVDEE